RFSVPGTAARGGRGEPVFVGDQWFFGLEYPAGHSRHTDGNSPEADQHHFELVGNYSFVDLEGHDLDTNPRPGLLRIFHFPGDAVAHESGWRITSKSSVAGGGLEASAQFQFNQYLTAIQKPARTFTHYNNWFDPAGKSLKGDVFTALYR